MQTPANAPAARSHGTMFFGIAGLLIFIAVAMPAGIYLSGTPLGKICGTLNPANVYKIWGVVLAVAMGLCVMGGYYGSRRLILEESSLRFQSWFHDEAWPLSSVASLSYQIDVPVNDTAPESYLALWDDQERRLARISLRGWDIPQFQTVFKTLLARRPAISVAPEVRRFLESEGTVSGFF